MVRRRLELRAGYTRREMAGWAAACWEEMFGSPKRNTNEGVQALLAALDGRVRRELKTPTELQRSGTPGLAVWQRRFVHRR